MNFFIVDNSKMTRDFLTTVIQSNELGMVVAQAEDGIAVTHERLLEENVDLLIIDLPMKPKDEVQTIKDIRSYYNGIIIIISQVIDKDTVANAYCLGVDYYITKPLNEIELVAIINKIKTNYLQQQSLTGLNEYMDRFIRPLINESTQVTTMNTPLPINKKLRLNKNEVIQRTANILVDLGIMGQSGYHDILSIIEYLYHLETSHSTPFNFPPMKNLFYEVAKNKNPLSKEIDKEAKALEQRVRRSILQSINHLASIGATDFGNITFDRYATTFFDFSPIRARMLELEGKKCYSPSNRLNIKKFIQVLYREVKDPL